MTFVSVPKKLMKTVIEQHSGRAMRATRRVARELLAHRLPIPNSRGSKMKIETQILP